MFTLSNGIKFYYYRFAPLPLFTLHSHVMQFSMLLSAIKMRTQIAIHSIGLQINFFLHADPFSCCLSKCCKISSGDDFLIQARNRFVQQMHLHTIHQRKCDAKSEISFTINQNEEANISKRATRAMLHQLIARSFTRFPLVGSDPISINS